MRLTLLARSSSASPSLEVPLQAHVSVALPGQRAVVQKELPFVSFVHELYEARWRILVAAIFCVALSVMFAVIGTQTFWRGRITWQGWVCLYTLIVTISVLIFELWDVTLTFFAANCVFLFSGIITLNQALAGFANASIVAIGAMFIIAVSLEKVRLLDWVVRNVLRRPTSLRYALLRVLPACAFLSMWTNNTPIVAVMIPVMEVRSNPFGVFCCLFELTRAL